MPNSRNNQKITVILFCLFFLCIFNAEGQIRRVQWASSLVFQYNQYQENDYSGQRALGPPDAFPPGNMNRNAFRLSGPAQFGTLKLAFQEPQQVQHVVIVENNEPGRVTRVQLIDENGFNYIIYQQAPHKVVDKFRTMVLSVPKTEYKVAAIEINVNSIPVPGYSQIDAVGILGDVGITDVLNILSGANFNVQQILTFTAAKERLNESINTKYTEAKPLVSHDGNTLYFSRLFHPDNTGGKSDPQDIYVSKYINGQWTASENIGFPLNDQYSNGVCSISPDGNKLLVINGYKEDGTINPGVSISYRSINGWGKPYELEITDFHNFSEFQDFFLSADERFIIMAIEREEGFGDQDLYVSVKNGPRSYTKPFNLGLSVNTSRAEFAPFLSADNTTLFFASDGHGGYGESDIFKVKRLDKTWKKWTKPQNLGPAVNTSSWEAYFSITAAGDYAYFVSSEGTRNAQENIYRIPLLQDIVPQLPESLFAFQGRTFDANTNQPISAQIILEYTDGKIPYRSISDDLTGNFLCYIPKENVYELSVKVPGYITFFSQIQMEPLSEENNIYKNIYLTPIETDQIFTLSNLLFERGKANLLDESYPWLEKLLGILQENPHMKIELAGHTDGLGSSQAKKNLSFRRVEKIKDYLIDLGIERKRIETIGYGGAKPLAPNDNEENRAKNRRVEVRVIENGA